MKNILIFGNSGSGKTTLAKQLQQDFELKHLDLDTLAWAESETPTRKDLSISFNEIDSFLANENNWVVEGCYADLLEYVAKNANEMIFLNPGIDVCIKHCRARPWEPHKYASKEEQDKNLDMLIDWVREYESRDDEFSLKQHKKLYDRFLGNKKEVKAEPY